MPDNNVLDAARLIRRAKRPTAFTGAGISVESGIPPFRGKNGLWNRYDPSFLDIGYFYSYPEMSWEWIKEIFFDTFGSAEPNDAHLLLPKLGFDHIITQNIDNMHQLAGSKNVVEFHGNSQMILCTKCRERFQACDVNMEMLPPSCGNCGGLLKPDFVFFGEPIPDEAREESFRLAQATDLMLVIGTTGQVMPACMVPYVAKEHGAWIIEINTEPSAFTDSITDIFLQGAASEMMRQIEKAITNPNF